jgi:hypothetical protein
MSSGKWVRCPSCGAELELPASEVVETDMASAVIVTDPGTAFSHIRDVHPEYWATACELRRRMNASPYIGGMPRKVDGTFLRSGEDVGDIAIRSGA